ncbi:MAG: glutamate-5-semialdehyde dehydrogenase [Verrucomicrobiota bacterium]|nr:glutamate-5-semialdehyde dehydrogenase [Verrucomicrobiota bacterium]
MAHMETEEIIHGLAVKARAAALRMGAYSTESKNAALMAIADALESMKPQIDAANAEDVAAAKANGISPAMIDRLTLTESRFRSMVDGVRHVATLPDPVGELIWERDRPSGIHIRKVRQPFGVIAVVFESRPNVFVDTAALCIKTSNAVILRGGKEAFRSNQALNAAVRTGLEKSGLPIDVVQMVETTDHAGVTALVRSVGLIDVAIPRGGERLIRAMCEAALIPVLKHYNGICHIYVDDKADLGMALSILDNAKTQRPGTCNAAECLLVHERLAPLFMPMVKAWAKDKGVTLHEDGVGVEYLSLDLNVATVKGVEEAIAFINEHGSHHSDCIVTNDRERAELFLRDVDSAAVYWNASTRFTDGAEFGMGAEIGISTDKLHARGPMGLEELTTYKYAIVGDGTIRQ